MFRDVCLDRILEQWTTVEVPPVCSTCSTYHLKEPAFKGSSGEGKDHVCKAYLSKA